MSQAMKLKLATTFSGFRSFNYHHCIACLVANPRRTIVSSFSAVGDLLCTAAALLLCKMIIAAVSAYDVFLTIQYFDSLPMLEMNPVGRWLMDLNGAYRQGIVVITLQQTATFVTAKVCGNFICFVVIEALVHWRRPIAAAVATIIAAGQLCLLFYLLFG